MATFIKHRKIKIVTLAADEAIADHCSAGDIALVQDEAGWWTHFVGENGAIDSYDAPFASYNKALWTAKAAAEFSSE
ncbi:hypothetical protein [Collimonas fungivorans]|uniref:Uncharacterized protein n=1 Tax=Collimonas fungivorans (strain Ter331) TaxID=1005048 RepID=G0AHQ6_COLFT|nr:hypothetical protein [Collimonas fungivorans]AEK60334.1 hypothetical protein CFU_0497 [Collimonas fungivorans Ter331]